MYASIGECLCTYSTQPDTTVGTVRFCTLYLFSLVLNFSCSLSNTSMVSSLVMTLIWTFLRKVWGGRKGEGYVPYIGTRLYLTWYECQYGTIPYTLYLKNFSRSKFLLCPFYNNKGALLWDVQIVGHSGLDEKTQGLTIHTQAVCFFHLTKPTPEKLLSFMRIKYAHNILNIYRQKY